MAMVAGFLVFTLTQWLLCWFGYGFGGIRKGSAATKYESMDDPKVRKGSAATKYESMDDPKVRKELAATKYESIDEPKVRN